jgi:hypothetical protein
MWSDQILGLPGGVYADDASARTSDALVRISWVTIERWVRKTAGPPGTAGVARTAMTPSGSPRLLDRHLSESERGAQESDWIWLVVLALWQRWWPAKPCLETTDDRIQEGYERLVQDRRAAMDPWLRAWSDVLQLCDATGITTIAGFDERFPMTQSLFNWNQDLKTELGNAGLDDSAKLQARITVGEEFLRRFTDCDQLMTENWHRAIAESWFWLGEASKADQLYRNWLEHDPQWGFGWIGWASGYLPPPRTGGLVDCRRAAELLRQGYAVSGVRDRDAVAEWLQVARNEARHPGPT